MTGFIRGLFGTRKKAEQFDEEAQPKKQGAYFLTPDDAKTFGDIDYMRTAKEVKRTFPKGDPRVRQISSMNDADTSGNRPAAPASQPMDAATPAPESKPPEKQYDFDAVAQRRKTDTSMDMFRNMAKEIRKD